MKELVGRLTIEDGIVKYPEWPKGYCCSKYEKLIEQGIGDMEVKGCKVNGDHEEAVYLLVDAGWTPPGAE